MNDASAGPAPDIFGSDAYSPAQIEDKVEKLGFTKAQMSFLLLFMLAIVAGGSIGLGRMFFSIILADVTVGFALQRRARRHRVFAG